MPARLSHLRVSTEAWCFWAMSQGGGRNLPKEAEEEEEEEAPIGEAEEALPGEEGEERAAEAAAAAAAAAAEVVVEVVVVVVVLALDPKAAVGEPERCVGCRWREEAGA